MKVNAVALKVSAKWFAILLGMVSLVGAGTCRAQITPSKRSSDALASNNTHENVATAAASAPVVADQAIASDAEAPAVPQVGLPPDDSGWHVVVAPYLWFPGVYGTVGARNRDVSVHATPGDLLSNFRFGLMGLVDTRYKRVVLPLDMMWVRLEDDKALPFPGLEEITAKLKGSEFILTPKIGYRLIDSEVIKIDALAGFRYWHFGESLRFSPSVAGLNFSDSQDWVDPLVGGRILGKLSPKFEVSIGGDVGGWGAGSQLDYQVAGLLGYRMKPAVALQIGYRYLDVNYRSGGTIIDVATHGPVMGVTITLK
ncbi:MAG TPA: hypothetical protein VFE61_17295 [Candidatus Sulfotelmatobacter sp.]|nr:hypothetical protein [Candidatus Sulfotelmatobacter sp.]